MWLTEAVRIWGIYTILIGGKDGEKATYEKTNDFQKEKYGPVED